MPLQRLYIYRCGTTNVCALTGEKGDPRLPAPLAPDCWRFWMQTGCHQTDNALYGFALETAMTQIAARGYYLFTGSTKLLETRSVARPAIPKLSIISDVHSRDRFRDRYCNGRSCGRWQQRPQIFTRDNRFCAHRSNPTLCLQRS